MLPRVRILAVVLITSFAASSAVLAGGGAQQPVLPIRATSGADASAPRGVVRVSVASDGTQANGPSMNPALSSDGRYVVFESDSTNLVPDDTNNRRDIYLHDRSTGITTRESISSGRTEANATSSMPRISGDGRFVAFLSSATSLVAGVTGNQVYVRDRQLGLTTVASVSSDGIASNASVNEHAISSDGRFITFTTTATNLAAGGSSSTFQVYTRDLSTGRTTRDSVDVSGAAANGSSYEPSISDDGRYVAFWSYASNLVSGLPASTSISRVFVHDRSTGQTTLASLGPSGETLTTGASPSLSGDGRFVAFSAKATTASNTPSNIYVRDLLSSQTFLVAANASNGSPSPKLSKDSRFISYSRSSTNITYAEAVDLSRAQTTTISPGTAATAIGGNAIAFDSTLTLAAGDTNTWRDVFVAPVGSDPGAPSAPTNLIYTLAASTLSLTWTAPSGGGPVADYLLEAGTLSRSTDATNIAIGTTDTRFTMPFSGRSTLYIRVRAANASGVSVPSNEIVVAPFNVPGAPEGLTASVAGNVVTLSWSASTGAISSYIIEAGAASGGTEIATFNTGNPNTTFTAPNVSPGTYFVRVKAVSLGGVGPASNEVSFTIAGGCQMPAAATNLTRSVVGSSLTLTWTAGAGATTYVLEAGTASGRTDVAVTDLNSTATTFITTGVPAGTYFLRVRSKNSCGQSAPSNEAVAIVSR